MECNFTPAQDRVLDAAGVLYEAYGYKKTTVDDIAQEAGISKGAIYLQFPSKEEICFAFIKRVHARILVNLRTAVQDEPDVSEKIRQTIINRVIFRFDFWSRHRSSMDEVIQAAKDILHERREECHQSEARFFQSLIQEGVAAGVFHVEDPETVSQCLVLASNSLLPYSLSTRILGDRDSVQRRADALARLLVRSLLANPTYDAVADAPTLTHAS